MALEQEEQRTVDYAKERLEEWARWLRTVLQNRLGYPSASAFVVERTTGFTPAGDPDNERAEQVERVMCELGRLRPTLYRALAAWYVAEHPPAVCAEYCGCRVSAYYELKKQGEMFVVGALLVGS